MAHGKFLSHFGVVSLKSMEAIFLLANVAKEILRQSLQPLWLLQPIYIPQPGPQLDDAEHFWMELVKSNILQQLPKVIFPSPETSGDYGTDCIIIPISQLDNVPFNQLERNAAIELKPSSDENKFRLVFYSTYWNMKQLEEQKKILFWKSYVQYKLKKDKGVSTPTVPKSGAHEIQILKFLRSIDLVWSQ